jgi:hypothetical protein
MSKPEYGITRVKFVIPENLFRLDDSFGFSATLNAGRNLGCQHFDQIPIKHQRYL